MSGSRGRERRHGGGKVRSVQAHGIRRLARSLQCCSQYHPASAAAKSALLRASLQFLGPPPAPEPAPPPRTDQRGAPGADPEAV
ncbi:hypothetical protein NDU88_006698 [Pleurodeles waltl]|uniref:Uncharacterized protein n=1 Tax=Pleurodeles waltl TaxID=8319 RepID=A0AAV7UMC2_PLEWA|nr:hypothetical protein NDU88_006698 [Pleurodeles waltl]